MKETPINDFLAKVIADYVMSPTLRELVDEYNTDCLFSGNEIIFYKKKQ